MNFSRPSTALFALAGLTAAASLPVIQPAAMAQTPQFSDVELSFWARPFIEKLAERNIIAGFPDGTFKPNAPVTRAQFAAILRQAFDQNRVREYRGFNDVSSSFWGVPAIKEAYETGFMSGYTDGSFLPNQQIPKVQAVVSLASGLELSPEAPSVNASLNRYRDAGQIPEYARPGVAAATQNGIVVNYPNVNYFNPNQVTTRADVAALVYQALVDQGDLEPLAASLRANQYLVRAEPQGSVGETPNPLPGSMVRAGTRIQVSAPGEESIRYAIVPSEVYATNLEVAEDIMMDGTVMIPKGSIIRGAFRPTQIQSGTTQTVATRYVADSVTIGNRVYPLNASSSLRLPVTQNELEETEVDAQVKPSDAARSVLRALFPNLGSAIFGEDPAQAPAALEESAVIIIDPEEDLDLTLQSGFRMGA
ncbi:S-layer homology domain-containing protein [Lyngbya confervoides]|uniref:S-layer homology domain-containing protein n=1 Tax=Lyngbya confervoides BDU141951 TaxID=1574623 RepID=A0ABD4SZK1_9CYAN|nr:S-layer homology domain-containing protein [Lyngbya confervoides]MCM1981698.1 S-layer homology domain-containing protein [Lyngbya confervoides BDU141951]